MFAFENSQSQVQSWPILDDEVLAIDHDATSLDALRAELSSQEAVEWTRMCVQQHLI